MPYLKLLELRCNETEDTGADEAYITVDGEKVWATKGISSGQNASLRGVEPIYFDEEVEVALWDEDTGLFDSDDSIGKFTVSADLAGEDEQEHNFTEDSADYLLIYKVLEDD